MAFSHTRYWPKYWQHPDRRPPRKSMSDLAVTTLVFIIVVIVVAALTWLKFNNPPLLDTVFKCSWCLLVAAFVFWCIFCVVGVVRMPPEELQRRRDIIREHGKYGGDEL
jgi:quinol-cytochrome oxidoreductase complex cytochrome b subunit